MSTRKSFDNETQTAIGQRIRKVRGKRTQEAFGAQIGVGRVAVANYEAGRRLPNRDTLEKIANLGHVTSIWILTGDPGLEQINEMKRSLEYCKENGMPIYNPSIDELSILRILRLIDIESLIYILNIALERYLTNFPDDDKKPKDGYHATAFSHKTVTTIKDIIETGKYKPSVDLEAMISGLDAIADVRYLMLSNKLEIE